MDSQRNSAPSWKESSCFTFALDTQRKRKRAKFDAPRKSEVATVRRIGACLRCRLLKASCSQVRPCENCVRAKLSSHVQVHKWMSCVSVSLREINVFKKALPNTAPTSSSHACSLDYLDEMPVCLCGENQITWSLDWVAGYITGWVEDRRSFGISRTGMLASPRLQCLLEPLLGPEVAASLRLLMLSTALVYNLGHDAGLSLVSKHRDEFHLARATSAEKVLRYLEETVTASFLNRPGGNHQRVQALIILAFGAMRSLAYFDDTEIRKRFEIRPTSSRPVRDANEMRDQLAGTLAHFLVLLIEKLGTACLRDKLPLILDNMQRHSTKPFITALPICGGPPVEFTDAASTPVNNSLEWPDNEHSADWQPSMEDATPGMGSPFIFDAGDDLQRILTNDLEALEEPHHAWNASQSSKFRQCIICSSPLRSDEPDALCIACQQPPDELWPGKKTLQSNESSLITMESSRGIISGQNSLSTSLTSQDSTFDEMMAMRDRPRAARATLPPPVEEEHEDDSWIFDAEDMDFSKGPALPENDEFPPGWSLYWDDSSDEQEVY